MKVSQRIETDFGLVVVATTAIQNPNATCFIPEYINESRAYVQKTLSILNQCNQKLE